MVLRCDCGFRVAGEAEADLVAAAQTHARDAHDTDMAPETVLGLLRAGRRHPPPEPVGDVP